MSRDLSSPLAPSYGGNAMRKFRKVKNTKKNVKTKCKKGGKFQKCSLVR